MGAAEWPGASATNGIATGAIDPEQLLDLAHQAGAEAAEVYQSQSLSRPVSFEANRLKQIESAQAAGTALRLWKHGRPGLAVAYGPVDPQSLIDRAIALSALNDPEVIELAETAAEDHYPDLGDGVSVDQLIEWGRSAIAHVRDRHPDVLCSAEWECDTETTRLINSRGLDCGYSDTTLGCYLSAEWVRGDDFLYVADGQTQRGYLDPIAIAQQVVQRLDWSRRSAATLTGRLPILFTAKAADMLWGTIQAALNGKQALEGASPWGGKTGDLDSSRLGDRVLGRELTISQRPADGPYSCPFDDEGTATREIDFVKDGILQSFYTDRKTGHRLGIGTTGNGFRPGLGSYPTPGLFNMAIATGQGSLDQLIANLPSGLVIDQMLGGGAGISGDFSVNVDLGFWVEQGQIVGRVKDTMVAGNVYSALKQVIQLGGDAEWNGSCYTPSIVVDGLSITGRADG
ncbi:MAG: TldD/PmbA family protein [Oscillatoriales cyanobacterium]|nr:MAG: TldD/PmbA family protein [Oscillatoriales cyanobacterium]